MATDTHLSLSSILKVLLKFSWGLVRFESTPNPSSSKLSSHSETLFLLFQMYVPISLAPANSCLLIMLTKELKFYQISISFFMP